MIFDIEKLSTRFDPKTGETAGAPITKRYLGDLRGCFADAAAYEAVLATGNPLLYTVASLEPGTGAGDLHYGFGQLMPGRVGDEYFMTKGHFHEWREAAEIYVGLSGEGVMLLEEESNGESRMVPLLPNHAVHVPGNTAHRTINTGRVPLIYVGVYPAAAGHDYGTIANRNFRKMVVERDGKPVMVERAEFRPLEQYLKNAGKI
jgi:glucose-6-phosphate isomerase